MDTEAETIPQEKPVRRRTERKKTEVTAKTAAKGQTEPVRIYFIGGVGEIGKNMTAIEYGDDILVVDAGLIFPTEEMPGIDLVVPDISFLVQNAKKVRGVILTHGHEDHIGGLPYLLKELNVPVYGTKLTLMLADNKIREHRIANTDLRVVQAGDTISLGCFSVQCVGVTHSIAGALAFAITTPQGVIYHSGDFKIDLTPVAGAPIDLESIARIGQNGVLLYLGESTNVERPGYTMSETVVGTTLGHLFAEHASRRIIVATFASNVHRLQQIIDIAAANHRKVALSGRSMLNVVDAALKIGELHIPEDILIDIEKIKNYKDTELVIVSTGSQGEPMSALTRMASGDLKTVSIGNNDTVIISASPIPGNEKMIYRVINNLYRKGAEVVYESLEKIHVSGHACQEEHKILHKLLRPKFFIPVHGEYRHLKKHADLAKSMGMQEGNILIADIGNCVELTADSIRFGESFPAGARLIDGDGFEDESSSEVMKDRRRIASEGMFIVSVALIHGEATTTPTIINKGFVFADDKENMADIQACVERTIAAFDVASHSADELAAAIRKTLKNYIFRHTKKSPLIVPIVTEL